MKLEVINRAIIPIEYWEMMFGLLKIYKERESHCNVPQSHKEDGKNLGVWLYTQRTRKKKGELDISLKERLEDIGVVWEVFKEQWENNYRLLVKFQQREGHEMFKKKGELDISLQERLDDIGVIWNITKKQWDNRYLLLMKFQQREGHVNVPQRHKEEGVNLGHWLNAQRQQKKKRKLDTSLEKRLGDVGVIWDVLKEQWKNNYRLLVKFQQREGHANVPQSHKEEGVNLGVWLTNIRDQKKKGKLDNGLKKHLEEVGVIWNVLEEQWENTYLLLVKYQQREGHANVPARYKEEGVNLGVWLGTQRQQKKK
eukprot:CAMPEP_0194194782 /NCGR_PEP_ID=MMETSP0154-20130528/75772_1 /TAXON_ID=1049557 /ORGANISM="Thalassiothrix antarctica, Strain L6-D1" /LENGTH=310 /DNA_ID=CAMNT_0038919243 /DNA_START=71 /DNA_END=1001 /DNA_ORIENTATION=+